LALHDFNDVIKKSQQELVNNPQINNEIVQSLSLGDNRVSLNVAGYLDELSPIAQRFNVNPIDIHLAAASLTVYLSKMK